MQEEIWKDIEGYEGYYQVSNLGRVRSLDRYVQHRYGSSALRKGKIIKTQMNNYPIVCLHKNSMYRTRYIHRLVAETFIPNPDNLPEVDHIDCDRTNNRVDNLRWCTHQDNQRFAKENGRMCYGGKKPNEMTPEEYQLFRVRYAKRIKPVIRSDGKIYPSCSAAAEDLGVVYSSVSNCIHGRLPTCKGYTFKHYIQEEG